MAESNHSQRRIAIQSALADFQNRSLEDAAIRFFTELGYRSDHTADFGHTADEFLANIPNADGFNQDKARIADWRRCAFLFQITGEDIPSLAERQRTFLDPPRPVGEGPGVRADHSPRPVGEGPGVRADHSPRPVGEGPGVRGHSSPLPQAGEGPGVRVDDIQSFVFLAIELRDEDWSRTALAGITRELNRLFPMPAIVLFKHGPPLPQAGEGLGVRVSDSPVSPSPLAPLPEGEGNLMISLAVIDRRAHLRDASRDVIDNRITVIKDVRCAAPHRAHLDILGDLAIENLDERRRPGTFRELYDAWIKVLSIQALNQRFYTELAWWYFWAVKQVQFPKGGGADASKRHAVAVIRLLTRLIFVWFIKEKGLIPPDLFDRARLRELLKTDPATDPEAGNYYLAILQNLFFATLNVEMGADEQGNRRRRWASENKSGGPSGHYLIPSVYRHKELFKDPDAALALFAPIPFLNGGLFECLDRELTEPDFQRNPELKPLAVKEGGGWVLRVDGFSRRKEARAVVPNKLFFGSATADLNADLGTKGKRYEVRGLIDLFDRYTFTVDENTPVEEEVALDPELLGKVFENLLASYNEDTQTTARKQSGSFYTPREVVDYMVDEALIAHFERHLTSLLPQAGEGSGVRAHSSPLPQAGEGSGVRVPESLPTRRPPAKLPDDIRHYARQMRGQQTDAEQLMWALLRDRRLAGAKFRRQHSVDRYILDFYCAECKIAVELDGGQHAEQTAYDENRSATLAKKGIRVLRFWNNQVIKETEGVLEAIYQAVLANQPPSPPTPLPQAGEGSLQSRLRRLLSYSEPGHDFGEPEKAVLIAAIESLKVLDPACGSGAFPMGVLHKLVHVLKKLDPDNILWRQQNRAPLAAQLAEAHKIPDLSLREEKVEAAEAALEKFDRDFSSANHADYTRKLYLIEKCIHGVDIQPIAVQIAKLRFFIALIVSQKVDATQHNHNVTALPNLETKIVAADSLMPIDRPAQGGLRDPAIDEKQKALIAANESYFAARTGRTKRKWRDRIFTLRDELAALLEQDRFLTEGAAKQLVHWNPFDQNAAADFFDPEWMFQLADGFDVVIGNPPYVRQEKIKELKPLLKKNYQCFTGVADLYVYFYERSIRLLKPEGIFSFITSNKWYRANYGEKLREWMNRSTRILSIIDFGDADVFTAIAYPTIIIAKRRKLPSPASGRGVGGEGETIQVMNCTQQHPVEIFPTVFAAESFSVPQAELKKGGWQLESPIKRRLLERICSIGIPLRDFVGSRVYRGITTGFNEAFIIDRSIRTRLIDEDPKSAEIIKLFLRGRDVKRWGAEFNDQYFIKIESSENKVHPWSGKSLAEAEKVFANYFPSIHAHFQNYRQALINRYDQGKYFWELRACTYWKDFEKPKILSTKVSIQPTFALDKSGSFLGNTAYFFVVKSPDHYLLALLNSNLSAFYAKHIFVEKQNSWYEVQPDTLEKFPIPKADAQQIILIDSASSAILAPTTLTPDPSPACGRGEWERLINGFVYELFFPNDLHQINIRLFDAAAKAGLDRLTALDSSALADAAGEIATVIFAPSHPIQGMLADLQKLEVVRVIEGRG